MPKEIEGIKFYTLIETADLLQVTLQTVRSYVYRGRLRAHKIGSATLITHKSLMEFLEAPEKVKPGRKKAEK
jgi:excisionase family DNA binding protein